MSSHMELRAMKTVVAGAVGANCGAANLTHWPRLLQGPITSQLLLGSHCCLLLGGTSPPRVAVSRDGYQLEHPWTLSTGLTGMHFVWTKGVWLRGVDPTSQVCRVLFCMGPPAKRCSGAKRRVKAEG